MTSDFSFLDDLPKDPQPDVSKAEIAIAPTKSKQKFEVGDLAVLPAEEGGSMIVKESNFKPSTPTQASFDPRFAFEVALGMESLVASVAPEEPKVTKQSQWFAEGKRTVPGPGRRPHHVSSPLKGEDLR